MKKKYVGLSLLVLLVANLGVAKPSASPAILRNGHIEAVFAKQGNAWSLEQCRRPDGSDVLSMDSDEFEILLLDGSRFTVEDYKIAEVEHERADGMQVVRFHYQPIASSGAAPAQIVVSYTLGSDPFIRKTVFLKMKEGDVVDGCRCCVSPRSKRLPAVARASPSFSETGLWPWTIRRSTAGTAMGL